MIIRVDGGHLAILINNGFTGNVLTVVIKHLLQKLKISITIIKRGSERMENKKNIAVEVILQKYNSVKHWVKDRQEKIDYMQVELRKGEQDLLELELALNKLGFVLTSKKDQKLDTNL